MQLFFQRLPDTNVNNLLFCSVIFQNFLSLRLPSTNVIHAQFFGLHRNSVVVSRRVVRRSFLDTRLEFPKTCLTDRCYARKFPGPKRAGRGRTNGKTQKINKLLNKSRIIPVYPVGGAYRLFSDSCLVVGKTIYLFITRRRSFKPVGRLSGTHNRWCDGVRGWVKLKSGVVCFGTSYYGRWKSIIF